MKYETLATRREETAMPDTDTFFTRKEYDLLPEGFPAELVRGHIVKQPASTAWHQQLVSRVAHCMEDVAGRDRVLFAPLDVDLGELDVYQPDVLLFAEGTRIGPATKRVPLPLLVVEVLSPSTEARDRGDKREGYLSAGVAEVWFVDPRKEAVERWTREGQIVASAEESLASKVLPGFALIPAELFRVTS